MHLAQEVFVALTGGACLHLGDLVGQAPDPAQVLGGCFGTGGGPFHVALGWRVRQHEPTRGVCAVLRDDREGIDDVVL